MKANRNPKARLTDRQVKTKVQVYFVRTAKWGSEPGRRSVQANKSDKGLGREWSKHGSGRQSQPGRMNTEKLGGCTLDNLAKTEWRWASIYTAKLIRQMGSRWESWQSWSGWRKGVSAGQGGVAGCAVTGRVSAWQESTEQVSKWMSGSGRRRDSTIMCTVYRTKLISMSSTDTLIALCQLSHTLTSDQRSQLELSALCAGVC